MTIVFERLRNLNSGKVATVADEVVGRPLQQSEHTGLTTQHWQRRMNNGQAMWVSRASGWLIESQGGVPAEHALIQQYSDHGGVNQRWEIAGSNIDQQAFVIHSNGANLVWDVADASLNNGASLQLYHSNGQTNQVWKFDQTVVENTFKIVSALSGLVMDLPGFSLVDGGYIQQNRDNGGFNQAWQIVNVGSGLSKIISVSSGKLLDAPLQAVNQPATIGQYSDNGGRNQLWRIQDAGNGLNKIIPALSPGFALDVIGGSLDDGTMIQQYMDNGGLNQRWQLIEV